MDDDVLATQCITLQSNSYSAPLIKSQLFIKSNIPGWDTVPETEDSHTFLSRLTEQIW